MSIIYNSDAEIVSGCQKNNRDAQRQLYTKFFNKMKNISMRYTASEDDAKDIVQDCFIQIFDKIKNFKGDGSLEGWIRRIVVNKSIDFINKKNKNYSRVNEEEQQLLNDSKAYAEYLQYELPSNESIYSAVITKNQIESAINCLKDSYKMIIYLNIIDGFSHKEIAEKLSISEELSRVRLKRARESLQSLLIGEIKKEGKK